MNSLELDMPRCSTSSEGTAAAATPSPDFTNTDWAAFWRIKPPSLPNKAISIAVLPPALRPGLRKHQSGRRGREDESAEEQPAKRASCPAPSPANKTVASPAPVTLLWTSDPTDGPDPPQVARFTRPATLFLPSP
jgi:hypothetical protein